MNTKEYCYSINGLPYSGLFDSREDALKEALEAVGDSTVDIIRTGVVSRLGVERFFPDAAWVLNEMACSADSEAGEFDTDFPDNTREAEADLDQQLKELLSNWCEKHNITVDFYHVEEEVVHTRLLEKRDL